MADIHLCPTTLTASNLRREGIIEGIYVTGNTVLDNLRNISTSYENKIVITMHRRENHHWIEEWFNEIDSLAQLYPSYEFILPIHPNPNVCRHQSILKHVNVVKPMEYNSFIQLLASCRFIITDSGGIQEESSFFGKKCIVCRKSTERTEGLGEFAFLCKRPRDLHEAFKDIDSAHIPKGVSPYGDGYASEKILQILKERGF
tara:strand:- start:3788 stop:4393 length:606 start_codon:yes stop_codon:yes gene_type:complete